MQASVRDKALAVQTGLVFVIVYVMWMDVLHSGGNLRNEQGNHCRSNAKLVWMCVRDNRMQMQEHRSVTFATARGCSTASPLLLRLTVPDNSGIKLQACTTANMFTGLTRHDTHA